MESADSARILGKLESMTQTTADSVERILDGQDTARRELLDLAQRLNGKLDHHAESDEKNFTMIRDGQGGLRDRIARLEPIADAVDVHGEALLDIERRINETEAVRRNNKAWQHGIVGLAGATIGGAGTFGGPKFWKWIVSLFAR
jgi:DNA repair ATPase RecN